jgi:hypothetical protein
MMKGSVDDDNGVGVGDDEMASEMQQVTKERA